MAMDHGDTKKRPARLRLLDMAGDLGFGHAGIMLKRQRGDLFAVLVGAANARKGDHGADIAAPVRQLVDFGGDFEGLALQADGRGHDL